MLDLKQRTLQQIRSQQDTDLVETHGKEVCAGGGAQYSFRKMQLIQRYQVWAHISMAG